MLKRPNRHCLLFACLLSAYLLPRSARAQFPTANWLQQSPSSQPSSRSNTSMVYDISSSATVLFGGDTGTSYIRDTWEWNGTNWSSKSPASSPDSRSSHAMAYDSSRQVVVLFGGTSTSTTYMADTWEWNGTNWSSKSPATSPSGRFNFAMVYDQNRNQTLLFGGSISSGSSSETWTWNGTNWSSQNPATKPTSRNSQGMAYDSSRGYVVLFGGSDSDYQNDTWEWDGTNWSSKSLATKPGTRDSFSMVYEVAAGYTLLYGGVVSVSSANDTWEWNGTNWSSRAPTSNPSSRISYALSYDTSNKAAYLFGGFVGMSSSAETWKWTCVSSCATGFELAGVTALRQASSVTVSFHATFDPKNAGLDVIRSVRNVRIPVNATRLSGTALLGSEFSYAVRDENVPEGAVYFIDAIDLEGSRTSYGPYAITPSPGMLHLFGCALGRATRPLALLLLAGLLTLTLLYRRRARP